MYLVAETTLYILTLDLQSNLTRRQGHDPAEYPAVSPSDAPRDHAGGLRHLPHHAEGSRGPGGAGRHLLR